MSVKDVAARGIARARGQVTAWRGRGKVHGILHAGLTVTDFEAAVTWYHDMFGFYLVSEDWLTGAEAAKLEALYGVADLQIRMGFLRAPDGSVLEIFQFDPCLPREAVPWNRGGYTHIALSVTNVPAVAARLRAKGVELITPEPQFVGGAHWVFFRDPDGNLLELIDLHANRLPLKYLGGIVGRQHKKGKWERYYRS